MAINRGVIEMKKISLIVLPIIIALGVSSCASTNVRPSDANLFQAAGNIHSGEFDRQLQRKQLDLGTSQADVQKEKQRQQALTQSLQQQRQILASAQADLNNIKQENAALELAIENKHYETEQEKQKKAHLLARIKKLKKNVIVVERTKTKVVSTSSAAKYRGRINQLKKEIAVLRKMAASS
jgi:chromosome segregation ATPase